MSHPVDRFYAAVSVLAGHEQIKQRLMKAFEDNLEAIDADELPSAAKKAFASLKNTMHQVTPANGEGPICASVRKMSIEEAGACAKSVVELYHEVRFDNGQAPLPLEKRGRRKSIPPFLVKSRKS